MKTENSSNSWDDLVFENRNKEYGAYSVRKSYSQHMTQGLGISVALACLILILPKVLGLIGNEKLIIPPLTDIVDETNIFTQPPVIPLPEPPPPPVHTVVTPPTNLPPEVVTTATDNTIATVDELSNAMPSTENGVSNVPTEASVLPIEAPPAIDYDKPFTSVQNMPQYVGGLQKMAQYFGRKMRYPSSAQRTGVEGTVFVSFVIDKEGKVTDVKVVKGISDDCDKEAIRVISSMDDWIPGRQNDRNVSVRMTLPIKFKLEH
jgi:periplasmic protein TonB